MQSAITNQGLFSNYFLDNLLSKLQEWSKDDHLSVFSEIQALEKRENAFLNRETKEAQLEEHFIRPILRLLRFSFEVQADVDSNLDSPDYFLFKSRSDLNRAHGETLGSSDRALAVAEAKRWGAELDRIGRERRDQRRNPSFQIWIYLHETEPKWGILTNGGRWRLYRKGRPLDVYYEVDLQAIIEGRDTEAFRNFYYFFRKEAFIPKADGEIFLEQVLKGSEDYARNVGQNLKENVYRTLRILAQGFLDRPENGLDSIDDNDLRLVQHSAMRLLYRLLFVLYAEGKGLLSQQSYYESPYSLYRLKHEIAEKRDSGQTLLPAGTSYWARLRDLFKLVNQGSQTFGVPRQDFFVPPYNGGLFDPDKNPFLEGKVMGDLALGEAIDLLARAPVDGGGLGFVDYSTLEIRHLGSIYEGLLEYRIQVADTRMVATGAKLLWKAYEEYEKSGPRAKRFAEFSPEDRVEPGLVYVGTHKGERKATGSYYTPDYIVRYIVEHVLGSIVEKKWQTALSKGESLTQAVLSTRVLDPAMGSGHFLVGAVEFLTRFLLEAVQNDAENGLIQEDEALRYTAEWARREVVSHCIYGVDLNELAVELAKVTLWLNTISKEKPLSFLDHHLKNGNSLIGAKILDLAWLPGERPEGIVSHVDKPFGLVQKILERLSDLSAISDDDLDSVKRKERLLKQLRESDEYSRIKALADVHTGMYFSGSKPETIRKAYMDLVNETYYGDQKRWEEKKKRTWARRAASAAQNRSLFHWELEFPEVFFDESGVKPKPGFDAIIGNPPYGAGFSQIEKNYLKRQGFAFGSRDSAEAFVDQSHRLVSPEGSFGMILPKTLAFYGAWKTIREGLLGGSITLKRVCDTGLAFPDSNYETIVLITGMDGSQEEKIPIDVAMPLRPFRWQKQIEPDGTVPLRLMRNTGIILFRGLSDPEGRLLGKLSEDFVRLSDRGFQIFRGLYIPDAIKRKILGRGSKWVNKVPHVREFVVDQIALADLSYDSRWQPRLEKMSHERAILKVMRGRRLVSAVADSDLYTTEKLVNVVPPSDFPGGAFSVCALFNSDVASFFLQHALFSKTTETSRVMDSMYSGKIPLPWRLSANGASAGPPDEQLKVELERLGETVRRLINGLNLIRRERTIFIDWLEVSTRSSVEEWALKTRVRDFDNYTLEDLVDVMSQNRKKLKALPHRTADGLRNLRENFEASVGTIKPLRAEAARLRSEISSRVHEIYRLSPDEIALVQADFSTQSV